jgi:hypothetical protein
MNAQAPTRARATPAIVPAKTRATGAISGRKVKRSSSTTSATRRTSTSSTETTTESPVRDDMRSVLSAVYLVLFCGVAVPLPAIAQERPLAGFQYVYVVMPQYGANVDVHGLGRFLREELRKEPSWKVVDDQERLGNDRLKLAQTLYCSMEHSWGRSLKNSVTLEFRDVLGNRIYSIQDSAMSFGDSPDDDIRKAIKGALRTLRKLRPRFDHSQVVDLTSLLTNVERVSMTENDLHEYLAENRASLSSIEGIWSDEEGKYKVGIIKTAGANTGHFVAFVLESKHFLWDPGMVKAKLTATAYETAFIARYFMGDHSEVGSTAKLEGSLLPSPFATGTETRLLVSSSSAWRVWSHPEADRQRQMRSPFPPARGSCVAATSSRRTTT